MDLIRRQYLNEINNRIMPFVNNNEGIFGKILFGDFEAEMSLTSMLLFRGFFYLDNGRSIKITGGRHLFYKAPFLDLLKINNNIQLLNEVEWASRSLDMRPSEFIYLTSFLYSRREGMDDNALSYLRDKFLGIVKDTAPRLVPYFAYAYRINGYFAYNTMAFGSFPSEKRRLDTHTSADSVLITTFIRFCKYIRSSKMVDEVRGRLHPLLLSIMFGAESFQEFDEESKELYEEYQRKHKRWIVSRRHEKRVSEIIYRYFELFMRREQSYLDRISCIEDYENTDQLMEALLHEVMEVEVVPKDSSAKKVENGGQHEYEIISTSCVKLDMLRDSYHFRFRNIIEFLARRLFDFHRHSYPLP